MSKQAISSKSGPLPVGPYSPAIKLDKFVFLSGQIPLTPSGHLVPGGIREQTEQVLKNASALLDAAGSSLANVVKTTVFLTNLQEFAAMNEVYAQYFTAPFPARSTIQVSALPRGASVEIEMIAHNP